MDNSILEFNKMRLESYKRLSLKQPLTNAQLNEYKALAKESYGIEI